MSSGNVLLEHFPTVSLVGKSVADHHYLHTSAICTLPPECVERVNRAADLAHVMQDHDFNVVKLHKKNDELSLLSYPEFFESPFPTLARSWRISLSNGTVIYRSYEESCNPPILHRKELLLLPNDTRIAEYKALTEAAEQLGLFEDTSRIGLREYWYKLVEEHGYEVVGHQLIPVANCNTEVSTDASRDVQRHLTALSRSNFSAPLQALCRHGLVDPSRTFFDYGCGRGDDVRNLLTNGIDATGWDPHYAPAQEKRMADTVNIGFVINVIEDYAERSTALKSAYAYTKSVLSVAAMLSSQAPVDGRPYRDGFLSSRNTFQKYYSQSQLRDFIEHTLDEPAIAAGPGVFFVFRDKALEQRFLTARYGRQVKSILSRGWTYERVKRRARASRHSAKQKVDRETVLFEANNSAFLSLWLQCLDLGRPPEKHELDEVIAEVIETQIGSLTKALRIAVKRFDIAEYDRIQRQKKSDLLVFAALQQFQKRQPYRHLDDAVQLGIRHFYGTYASLQAAARQELFDLVNLEKIDAACKEASEKGYGWLEDSHSLQLHSSHLERLPTILRIYVGCATALYGDTSEFDLIKIHIRSGKVTLMKFDDFENSALPRLQQRVKVKLKEQDLDIFLYGGEYPPTLLYHKSRFINEEFPHYFEQVEFEEKLNSLGLHDLQGYGPPEKQFFIKLQDARWEIDGFTLVKSNRIPELDSLCGAHFTYRQLIECGETQQRTRIPNIPVQADTYTALYDLAVNILDPVIDYFGMVDLTYAFCSAALAKQIKGRIAPHLDQHAAHERNLRGKPICDRLGAACDFIVADENMEEVAQWVMQNTPVDRLYFYGRDRPIHVSFSETPARQFVRFMETESGRMIPKVDRSSRTMRNRG